MPFFHLPDITAVKLCVIARRGAKKDFYDMDCLSHEYTFRELIVFIFHALHYLSFRRRR